MEQTREVTWRLDGDARTLDTCIMQPDALLVKSSQTKYGRSSRQPLAELRDAVRPGGGPSGADEDAGRGEDALWQDGQAYKAWSEGRGVRRVRFFWRLC